MVSVLLKGRVQDNTAHLWEAPKAGQEAPQPSCRGGVPVSTQSPGTCGNTRLLGPVAKPASLPTPGTSQLFQNWKWLRSTSIMFSQTTRNVRKPLFFSQITRMFETVPLSSSRLTP